jgi:hypothetical protein
MAKSIRLVHCGAQLVFSWFSEVEPEGLWIMEYTHVYTWMNIMKLFDRKQSAL